MQPKMYGYNGSTRVAHNVCLLQCFYSAMKKATQTVCLIGNQSKFRDPPLHISSQCNSRNTGPTLEMYTYITWRMYIVDIQSYQEREERKQ
jgi:hypothetical protein